MGFNPGEIEALFLTHFHSDHIDGLGEVMLQRWAGGSHVDPLPVYGPTGVEEIALGAMQIGIADTEGHWIQFLGNLGVHEAPCLIAKDDETFSYNHHINRLSNIAEHYMIRRAIDRGVSKERLARAFNVNLSSINRRINLLEGICPEAIDLLQDKQFTPDVTRILRNMKAARKVEAVELMIASNSITVAHAEALLKATPPEQRTDVKPAEREKKTAPIEQIEKLEKEMSQVQEKYQEAGSSYGSDLLNLVVAKGYLTKLLANGAVKSYIGRHEPEIMTQLELVVNTVSMEEAVQQQAQTAEATQEEATPRV